MGGWDPVGTRKRNPSPNHNGGWAPETRALTGKIKPITEEEKRRILEETKDTLAGKICGVPDGVTASGRVEMSWMVADWITDFIRTKTVNKWVLTHGRCYRIGFRSGRGRVSSWTWTSFFKKENDFPRDVHSNLPSRNSTLQTASKQPYFLQFLTFSLLLFYATMNNCSIWTRLRPNLLRVSIPCFITMGRIALEGKTDASPLWSKHHPVGSKILDSSFPRKHSPLHPYIGARRSSGIRM